MKHYEALTTTRTRQLQRQLDRIEDLRSRKNLPLPEGPVGGAADEKLARRLSQRTPVVPIPSAPVFPPLWHRFSTGASRRPRTPVPQFWDRF